MTEQEAVMRCRVCNLSHRESHEHFRQRTGVKANWIYRGKVGEPVEEEDILSDRWLLLPAVLFITGVPFFWWLTAPDISNLVVHTCYSIGVSVLWALTLSFGLLLLWGIHQDGCQ